MIEMLFVVFICIFGLLGSAYTRQVFLFSKRKQDEPTKPLPKPFNFAENRAALLGVEHQMMERWEMKFAKAIGVKYLPTTKEVLALATGDDWETRIEKAKQTKDKSRDLQIWEGTLNEMTRLYECGILSNAKYRDVTANLREIKPKPAPVVPDSYEIKEKLNRPLFVNTALNDVIEAHRRNDISYEEYMHYINDYVKHNQNPPMIEATYREVDARAGA